MIDEVAHERDRFEGSRITAAESGVDVSNLGAVTHGSLGMQLDRIRTLRFR
ncbi:MAG: hypothetical protein WCD20_17415 [Rhodomicrobium sp.]